MKKIKFHTDNPEVMKYFPPVPISRDLPEWTADLNSQNEFNVSHCPPVMDWMNSGYLIYNAWEIIIEEKIFHFQKGVNVETINNRLNLRKTTPTVYAADCMPVKNGPYSYFRIETDYKVVTPPGYSCLVMQPYYDFNNSYNIMPGIIDTDKHDWVVSAVGFTRNKNLRIVPGEKMLQIIPFKRDDWTMELETTKLYSQLFHYIKGAYNKLFRAKKVYK